LYVQRDQWGAICDLRFIICQREYNAFKDWPIDIEFSTRGAESGGEAITFLDSDTIFPQQSEQFNDFQTTFKLAHANKYRVSDPPMSISGSREFREILLV
jgi:hypothetical protein